MQAAARQAADDLNSLHTRFDPRDVSETQALLAWMEDRHFTFLGYREYRLRGRKALRRLGPRRRQRARDPAPRPQAPAQSTSRTLPADIRRQSRSRDLALVTKANLQSTVHRAGLSRLCRHQAFRSRRAELIGERRFLGLWTSSAYNANPREIPLVRHKVAQVVQHFALAPDSHDGKALQHILESFPRGRAVPGERARAHPHRHGDLRSAGAAARAPAAAPRCVPPVLLLPGLRAAREIQHAGAPAHRARHRRGFLRLQHGIAGADRRIEPRADPHRRPHLPSGRTRIDADCAGTAHRGRGPLVGR